MYTCMAFGVKQAPSWLQFVMDEVLGRAPGRPGRSFFDDVQVPGTSWWGNWRDTVLVLRVLAQAGFMINLRKC